MDVNKNHTKPIVNKQRKLTDNVKVRQMEMPNDYHSFIDQKFEGSISSPTKTREDPPEEYRLEQRFPDDNTENTKNLGNIKEETAESVSSDDGRHKVPLISRKRVQIKNYDKRRDKPKMVSSQ